MTLKDVLKAPRVFIPIAGFAGSGIAAKIALTSHDKFPAFETMVCEGNASGCLEWGMLFFGPFYLIGYLLFVAFLVMLAAAPLAIATAIWLSPMTKRRAETKGSVSKSSKMTVWAALKDIIRGNEPNA